MGTCYSCEECVLLQTSYELAQNCLQPLFIRFYPESKSESDEVEALREETISCIKRCWDEVEFYYSELVDEKMRKAAIYYGITYISRPGERKEDGILEEDDNSINEKPLPEEILNG